MAKMTEQAMQELAEKLIGMKINKARGYTRRLDPDVTLELLRVDVGHEILTRYRLPNQGVTVTLVEMDRVVDMTQENTNFNFQEKSKFVPDFVEARVVAID